MQLEAKTEDLLSIQEMINAKKKNLAKRKQELVD